MYGQIEKRNLSGNYKTEIGALEANGWTEDPMHFTFSEDAMLHAKMLARNHARVMVARINSIEWVVLYKDRQEAVSSPEVQAEAGAVNQAIVE